MIVCNSFSLLDNSSKLLHRTQFLANTYESTVQPIETFNIVYNVKCFTFFSYLSQLWKDFRIDFLKFRIFINPKYNWIPPHMVERYYLAIHSPKSIPILEYGTNFVEVKPNMANSVTLNKMNVDVENSRNCYNYDDDEYLRSDCITICLIKKIQNNHGNFYAMRIKYLFRKEYSKIFKEYNQALDNKPDISEPVSKFKPECMQQCKQDCSFEYYIYDISTEYKISNDVNDRALMNHIEHNNC